MACGLYTAMAFGLLTIWTFSGFPDPTRGLSSAVLLAGLFTFPIGTGLYYLCSAAFGDRAAIASQFSNVKPIFSIAVGYAVFYEALGTADYISIAIIVIGVAVMLVPTIRGANSVLPVLLGLTLAVSWSAGEAFVRLASGGTPTVEVTIGALFSSVILFTPLLLVLLNGIRRNGVRPDFSVGLVRTLVPFALHGVISFGGAYFFFFGSIASIGLSRTVMITVAWPALAMAIDVSVRLSRSQPLELARPTVIGLSLLTCSAVVHAVLPAFLASFN